MRKLIYALIGAGLLASGAALHYALPRVSTAQIVGVEVKRVDGDTGTRDVYMIQAQVPETDAVRVYRNEDALLYLKLNSADLQARATAFSRGEELRTVAIRHYGWRIPFLSVFPNAISVWEVSPGYRHLPILNAIIFISLLLVPSLLALRMRKGKKIRPVRASQATTGGAPAQAPTDEMSSWLATDDLRPSSGGGGSDVSSSGPASSRGGSDV